MLPDRRQKFVELAATRIRPSRSILNGQLSACPSRPIVDNAEYNNEAKYMTRTFPGEKILISIFSKRSILISFDRAS
jgi:hypothetical protein